MQEKLGENNLIVRQLEREDAMALQRKADNITLESLFHLPMREAAVKYGMCHQKFRATYQAKGIPEWPYQRPYPGARYIPRPNKRQKR